MNFNQTSIYPPAKGLYKYFSLYQSGYFSGASDPANLLACYFAYLCTTKENILELGIGNGAFLYCLANGINAPQSYGVDSFDAPFSFPAEKFVAGSYSLLNKIFEQSNPITLLNCYTKNLSTIEQISTKTFSLIHIDADHSTDSVISDAQNCSVIISEDGLLIFDDVHLDSVKTGLNTWLCNTKNFKRIFRLNDKIYVARDSQCEKWNNVFSQFSSTLGLDMDVENDYLASYIDLKKIYLGTTKDDLFGPMYDQWLEIFQKFDCEKK